MTSILLPLTDNISITKIDEMKVSNNMNIRTLPEYKSGYIEIPPKQHW